MSFKIGFTVQYCVISYTFISLFRSVKLFDIRRQTWHVKRSGQDHQIKVRLKNKKASPPPPPTFNCRNYSCQRNTSSKSLLSHHNTWPPVPFSTLAPPQLTEVYSTAGIGNKYSTLHDTDLPVLILTCLWRPFVSDTDMYHNFIWVTLTIYSHSHRLA